MSVQANVVTDVEAFEAGGAGTVMLTTNDTALMIKCPKCGEASALPLHGKDSASDPGWSLVEKNPITLHPSIQHDVGKCGYHGWLRKGVFTNI